MEFICPDCLFEWEEEHKCHQCQAPMEAYNTPTEKNLRAENAELKGLLLEVQDWYFEIDELNVPLFVKIQKVIGWEKG